MLHLIMALIKGFLLRFEAASSPDGRSGEIIMIGSSFAWLNRANIARSRRRANRAARSRHKNRATSRRVALSERLTARAMSLAMTQARVAAVLRAAGALEQSSRIEALILRADYRRFHAGRIALREQRHALHVIRARAAERARSFLTAPCSEEANDYSCVAAVVTRANAAALSAAFRRSERRYNWRRQFVARQWASLRLNRAMALTVKKFGGQLVPVDTIKVSDWNAQKEVA